MFVLPTLCEQFGKEPHTSVTVRCRHTFGHISEIINANVLVVVSQLRGSIPNLGNTCSRWWTTIADCINFFFFFFRLVRLDATLALENGGHKVLVGHDNPTSSP